MSEHTIIPNTTQIPHIIIREWMPKLKDVELRILLVVADQTLGWIEDRETGRRKEKDWISRGQLMQKTGKGHSQVSAALKVLIEKHKIIEAYDESENMLDTAEKRRKAFGKIFYRLSLKHPPMTLFDTAHARSRVQKSDTKNQTGKSSSSRVRNLDAQNSDTTKETVLQNLSPKGRAKPASDSKEKRGEPVDKAPTRYFFWKFGQLTKAIRNTKPKFVKHKDGQLIIHALRHLNEFQLELELIWFLQNKPTMRPCLGAALCKEVIGDFIRASYREYGFYGNLERTAMQYSKNGRPKTDDESEAKNAMIEALQKLKASFAMPISDQERTQIAEETSMAERTARV